MNADSLTENDFEFYNKRKTERKRKRKTKNIKMRWREKHGKRKAEKG